MRSFLSIMFKTSVAIIAAVSPSAAADMTAAEIKSNAIGVTQYVELGAAGGHLSRPKWHRPLQNTEGRRLVRHVGIQGQHAVHDLETRYDTRSDLQPLRTDRRHDLGV
jgi:hypothetical protein